MEYLAACIVVFLFIGLPAISAAYCMGKFVFMVISDVRNSPLISDEEHARIQAMIKSKA